MIYTIIELAITAAISLIVLRLIILWSIIIIKDIVIARNNAVKQIKKVNNK